MADGPQGARAALRSGTTADHERLDALFGRFSLGDAHSYRAFLTAHALALPAIERALDDAGFATLLCDWPERRRSEALAADLVALGAPVPAPLPFVTLESEAAQWGAAYVIEGSRLGGALLARQIADGLPRSYLGTAQPPGAWRAFLQSLDKALFLPQDVVVATEMARATFGLFEAAGSRVMGEDRASDR